MDLKKIFSVSEFNEFIRVYLNQVGEVTVEGEISKINISQDRWLFITIKDETATVEIFSTVYKITNLDLLEEGMLVHIYGIPNLHQKSGKFSLTAHQIVPAGEGALRVAFEKLKLKLEQEGLFAPERKRPLPLFPQRIGLITAKDSQAYSDFVKVLTARMGGMTIYFYPVQVQGRESVESIVDAFDYFNRKLPNLDLLVLVRGGGSLEDLQSFNDERLVRAIFGSHAPVVCGVGHEKDVTLSDLVADLRASTPSNAAEMIVKHRQEIKQHVDQLAKFIEYQLDRLLKEKQQMVNLSVSRLKSALGRQMAGFQSLLTSFIKEFIFFGEKINQEKVRLKNLVRLLQNLDYRRLLNRGFSITTDKTGKILRSIGQVNKNDDILTKVSDGRILSSVKMIDN